jgi:Prenyltransferase and squalene oxidase repeat
MPRSSPATPHPARRVLGRPLGALAAAALLCAAVAPAARADSASPAPSASAKLPAGLFGTSDPTYDGVWRQSTALLALHAVAAPVPAAAVDWLTGQQCADGGFGAYRAAVTAPCAARSEDTNSTGLAVQALTALGGHGAAVRKAAGWLESAQNKDGGWGYQAGAPSDTDSTAIVAGALRGAGTAPAAVTKGGRSPQAALAAFQLGCGAKAAQRGAFAYQPDAKSGKLAANDKATTDGILGMRSAGYLVTAPDTDREAKALTCPADHAAALDTGAAAQSASAYLSAALTAGGEHLTTAQPGSAKQTPDYGTTAYAVIALAADGHRAAAQKPFKWLAGNGTGWAKGSPAALGSLILASAAVGANPHDFGGADLVAQLSDTGPSPAASPTAPSAAAHAQGGGTSSNVWWIVGAGLLAGVGIGGALSLRKKKRP